MIGFGAYSKGQWFYGAWSVVQANLLHTKNLFPVVIAADLWTRKHVFFRSDNEAVVAILTTRTSKVLGLMHLHDLLSAAC